MLRHVDRQIVTDVSEQRTTSIFILFYSMNALVLDFYSFVFIILTIEYSEESQSFDNFLFRFNEMCVLIFSTTFVSNISDSNNNSARFYHKHSYKSSYKVPVILA